jgi:hypothetical protein
MHIWGKNLENFRGGRDCPCVFLASSDGIDRYASEFGYGAEAQRLTQPFKLHLGAEGDARDDPFEL